MRNFNFSPKSFLGSDDTYQKSAGHGSPNLCACDVQPPMIAQLMNQSFFFNLSIHIIQISIQTDYSQVNNIYLFHTKYTQINHVRNYFIWKSIRFMRIYSNSLTNLSLHGFCSHIVSCVSHGITLPRWIDEPLPLSPNRELFWVYIRSKSTTLTHTFCERMSKSNPFTHWYLY